MRWLQYGWLLGVMSLAPGVMAEPLRIGFGTHKPPYIFEHEARGLEYDIVAAAIAAAGFTLEAHYAPMERLHLALRRGDLATARTLLADARAPWAGLFGANFIGCGEVALEQVDVAVRGWQTAEAARLLEEARVILDPLLVAHAPQRAQMAQLAAQIAAQTARRE